MEPRRHDGAPLRRLNYAHDSVKGVRRPRRHDGAPLRPRQAQQRRVKARAVVPVVTTGLHCGIAVQSSTSEPSKVVPVVTTGLHCGDVDAWLSGTSRVTVVPVVTTGLHCGKILGNGVVPRQAASSPSSRRGSIAAGRGGLRRQPEPSRRPRRHDGAPLRHLGGRRGGGRGWRRPRRHDGAPLRHGGVDLGPDAGESSPSSRRGSIAAPGRPRGHAAVGVVVPVVTTGLHCGG